MGKKLFQLLGRNSNCVLLKRLDSFSFKVIDIENDTIYIGSDKAKAEEIFASFDINEVREQKEKLLAEWLKEFVQS